VKRFRIVAAIALLGAGVAPRARAQSGVLLQGVVDAEGWSTTTHSNLLTRNAGQPAAIGRLQMWGAFEPLHGVLLYAQGEAERGPAPTGSRGHERLDQLGVRYIASPALTVDAGRFTPIIGNAAVLHLSTRNPLIGEPDTYGPRYPAGIKVSGELRGIDYRLGVVDVPPAHPSYVPTPSPRARPEAGIGYTPVVGLRVGLSGGVGSYLDRDTPAAVLGGRAWSDYHQRVLGADVRFARGYLETRVEVLRGSYDVPNRGAPIVGFAYYGEAKYTFTPRFFVATRLERNKYPFIREFGSPRWTARLVDFVDGEAGAGYRLTRSTIVKASVRADRWWVAEYAPGFRGRGGRALALQLSQSFDVMSWVDRAHLY
jgi:hypothetical protein